MSEIDYEKIARDVCSIFSYESNSFTYRNIISRFVESEHFAEVAEAKGFCRMNRRRVDD